MVFDLRSDLLSGCAPDVVDAMVRAARRPPAMGQDEDPDERALFGALADTLGKQAALFVPTCTMANQIALRLWCQAGATMLAERSAHVVTTEAKATALSVDQVWCETGRGGHLLPETVHAAVHDDGRRPDLVWLENTSMRAGGTIMPDGWLGAITAALHGTSTRLHIDGSRLWNASVASSRPMHELVQGADTVAVSLNKVVGAPLGAVLVGARDIIERAAAHRDQMGGNWRPTGILAAGALTALNGWSERIACVHDNTAHLASLLRASLGPCVSRPETNIILMDCPQSNAVQVLQALRAVQVYALALNAKTVRLVLHRRVLKASIAVIASTIIDVVR